MENETHSPEPQAQKKGNKMVPLAIIFAGIIIAGAVVYTGNMNKTSGNAAGAQANAQGAATPPVAVNIKNVKTDGEPFIGDPNAPVTIAYWSDYQCPFCKQFETQTLSQIIDNYVKTGKVKVVFKDFQFLGPDSGTDSLFARAVWQLYPKQYFAWRTAMYNSQDGENTGFGDEASVVALTKTISGIDVTKVEQLISQDQKQFQTAIEADRTEGSNFGIQGTPGFIIGDQLIPGAVSYASFQQAIDAQLAKSK